MASVNYDEKIQEFFDSVIDVLEISKLYNLDGDQGKIQSNINIIKHMKSPIYFQEHAFNIVGGGLTSCGFRQFDNKVSTPLFKLFHNTIDKISIYYSRKDFDSVREMISMFDIWKKVKPNTFIQNIIKPFIPKNFFAQRFVKELQHAY